MNPFRLELSSSVRINAPRERVWQVFADIARWTEWCGVCLRADPEVLISEDFDWQPGQRINLKFRMSGVGVPFNVAITDTQPERSVAWASTKLSVTAVRTFTFTEELAEELAKESAGDPAGASVTVVTDHKLFTSPILPLRLFYPRPLIRSMTERMLADLKTECERPPA
ncbi:MAG: SRPBCC family protein [Chloroflexi bacterium]|nr:SRPBCC family protein [Chloroflexota bacterium]